MYRIVNLRSQSDQQIQALARDLAYHKRAKVIMGICVVATHVCAVAGPVALVPAYWTYTELQENKRIENIYAQKLRLLKAAQIECNVDVPTAVFHDEDHLGRVQIVPFPPMQAIAYQNHLRSSHNVHLSFVGHGADGEGAVTAAAQHLAQQYPQPLVVQEELPRTLNDLYGPPPSYEEATRDDHLVTPLAIGEQQTLL